MEKKIFSIQSYLRENLSLDVKHEALISMHRFHIDQQHIFYVPHEVLRDKQLDEILALLDFHDIVNKIKTASAPTLLHLSDNMVE